ncbi:hypothetical protein P175DRAFT_0446659 [Aspergillus ochraceoroseus IBT 24754]|uniref:PHD-type domain-containing protein n=3 Tax=Aspergillus subgen. Nidulantes TaxID=2720870 RepID=A0A0F8URM5_9EURO|nr:uncharacterized protein P175DRAFT_0446659 [Aspergillus ochraceoroseus IBT 24754]KKK13511.1 hypothetical protein ARAM_003513 [Aspergillus rambellii]KKK20342.1 hypothetical protein AOCH_001793 [Aspergillus ochraceoroseus]PTU17247.1 hypothetical protein P175DRAFT_0446659 [Aspergillus ochraceoroseus IBT 24754]
MAPNLRSSSHAGSNNSRPSTPVPATASAASPFTESTRPRKQRRTGRTSRVATDPLQDPPTQRLSRRERFVKEAADNDNESHALGQDTEWTEPPVRAPVPSYADTPWSAVSSDANPVLATMRPLGAMPSAADLRKVGLAPSKPSTPIIPAKKDLPHAPNGEKIDEKPQTPLTPAEEPAPEPAPAKPTPEEDLAAFTVLPVPSSADVDVEKLKVAVEKALRLASETDNRPVIRGLLHLWEKCSKDPFALSILDGICQENPGPREKSAFQTVMRSAWKEVRSEQNVTKVPLILPTIVRTRSASTASSLSSAKSLDAEIFAPAIVSRASNTRSRKGKQSRSATQKPDALPRRPAFPSNDPSLPQKQTQEDPDASAEAVQAKRTRLQRALPTIVASESKLRYSLASNPSSDLSSPGPHFSASRNRGGRSESIASSDAGDNRRLTPSLTDNERPENNDFCRNCNGSGQLLCCDGCINSFHFSCLNPPLDPANPPEGDWYCPKCSVSRPLDKLLGAVDKVSRKDFALPARIRDFFTGIRTGDGGRYEEVAPLPRMNPRGGRGNRSGRYDDPFLLRTVDAKGNLIFCTKCGRTSNGRRPIIQCDYCPCAFHMDCVDPPLAIPPTQRPGSERVHHNWMCPNHVWHDMYYVVADEEGYDMVKRIRHPKRPRFVDVEILPDEEEVERIEEQEEEGIMYRVSEKGVKLDFIERVKRENETLAMKKAAADKYLEYAKTKFDELLSEAHAFYTSEKPVVTEEDTTAAILNSRTVAEREAAANLIEFAQSQQVTSEVENGRINLLIDQLKANAPNNLPSANTEIESLRTLQDLIEQRIKVLNSQPGNIASSKAQPTSSEHPSSNSSLSE